MKKSTKNRLFTCLLLIASVTNVHAEDLLCLQSITYELFNNSVYIVKVDTVERLMVIPDSISFNEVNYPVEYICDSVFLNVANYILLFYPTLC